MEGGLGLGAVCSERKGGNLECNKLLFLTAKPKGLMGIGMGMKFVCNVMCHIVSTTVLGYKPNTSRIAL